MSRTRLLAAVLVALTFVALASTTAPAGAASSADTTAANKAVAWLKTQQQADGGFEVAGSPGFETRDAVLAIAEAAQTSSTWSTSEALAAVQAVTKNGKNPLDELDTYADSGIGAGAAGKLIVLVVAPLGLDPTHFDPAGNGGSGSDLVARLGSPNASGSFGVFSDTLYGALAWKLVHGSVPASTIGAIRAAQEQSGGWDFSGDPTKTTIDIDTTALAVQALVAAGVPTSDPALQHALTFLATNQNANGSWSSFGSPDPNSTSTATMAVTAAGYDTSTSCWRDTFDRSKVGTAYVAPDVFLRSLQQADGRIASPNDSFGINTFATSQTVEALLLSWLPVNRADTQVCVEPAAETTPTTITPATAAPANGSGASVEGTSVENGDTAAGALPNTGAHDTVPLAAVGGACIAVGIATIVVSRRRRLASE